MGEPIDPLAGFGPATRAWFAQALGAPTPVQAQGWPAIARGEHALLCAPTGSGKTLAAFLACLDRLARRDAPAGGVRVVYLSPLKALAYDVERNLRVPLAGIAAAAEARGEAIRPVRIATRTGDTPARERRRLARDPADILITTPESLYLLLGAEARRVLAGVETVIVDEIHALAPDKRGAHLALSLERLSALCADSGAPDPQRIGLSATQRPLEEVARFLGGARPVTIVDAGARPRLELVVEAPVEEGGEGPSLHARVLALIAAHRSTIVFCNSRRLCERFAARLNELWAEAGHAEVLVRAHHGSVAREQRVEIEEALKGGRLRGLCATSALELGIDMGAVDLVVQIESPGSVARGLQRVGRAGHHVGGSSRAFIFPRGRHDLAEAAVVARGMCDGAVEAIRVPRNPLDVLAQQIVAMTADRPRTIDQIEAIVRASHGFRDLSRELLVAVIEMLAGTSPGVPELHELKPRVVWDRATDTIAARADARFVAIANAGTIADRGLYGVYLEGGGPRVGELDEEMVHESRVGQTFLLGASTWRITEIGRDRVIVRAAPGEPGRMPFWRGEGPGRPIELGRALGAFLREMEAALADGEAGVARARATLRDRHQLTEGAAAALAAHLDEQRRATGRLPSDRTVVVERFRDELGDWRVCLLSPFGARVHAPLALAIEARLAARAGAATPALHSDDGITLRLGNAERPPELASLLPASDEVEEIVLGALRGSSLFAARFRENASRSLLLPRRFPGRRTPLWSQRLRASALLAATSGAPGFPIVLETYRECSLDVFDLPALRALLAAIEVGEVALVEVETARPSPFARALSFAYVAAFLYEGDAPLGERKAQALTLDRGLLRELLGEVALRELLDPRVLDEVEAELQSTLPERRARTADQVHDLLRRLGDLSDVELAARCEGDPAPFVAQLLQDGRATRLVVAGEPRHVAAEDAARYRDPLPALPVLLARYARTHGPFPLDAVAARLGVPLAALAAAARLLVVDGRLLEGELRPGGTGLELCDPEVLRRIRRRTLAALRREIAPVDAATLARFLPAWHGVGDPREGPARLREAVAQLDGLALPFSELEEMLLPARVAGFAPRLLDELGAAGEVVWIGRGAPSGDGGRVALYRREHAPRLLDPPPPFAGDALAHAILDHLARRGAAFFFELQGAVRDVSPQALEASLWELAWAGQVTNDTFAPLRAIAAPAMGARVRPGAIAGRWSRVADLVAAAPDPTAQAHARALVLLERHGVVAREVAAAEELPGGFTAVADVLRAMEEAGRVRRGYFVEGLAGMQFALPGALDRLRAARADPPSAVALSAIDPASPFGAVLGWPAVADDAARPRRVAGAIVVTHRAQPALFVERGGRRLTLFPRPDDAEALPAAVEALRRVVDRLGRGLRIGDVDGRPALRSPHASALERLGLRVEPGGLALDPRPVSRAST